MLGPETTVEHAGLKGLIAELLAAEPDGESYDASAKASSLDMAELGELGARMAARNGELLARTA